MPSWFDHVEAALRMAGVPASYAFVVSAGDETVPVIRARAAEVVLIPSIEPEPYEERQWHQRRRVERMVDVRNQLLELVRAVEPDVFLSVDSDILLHPMAIADMLEGLGRFGAVGGGTFLTEFGDQFPSCGWVLGHDGFRRERMLHQGTIPVGVIMAVKAMSPAAYAVDYQYNMQGEDIGWSVAAAHAGVRLGWDNRHYSKHVMTRAALDRVDERCGF
jgi:hypothetical protein